MLQTIAETRRARLEQLIQKYGKLADLNVALGYERTATTLARIRNSNERKDRPGKAFQMGDAQAREIEMKLELPRGWMDTPPGFEALEEQGARQLLELFSQLPSAEKAKAVRLLDALAEPPKAQANGAG